MRLLLISGKNSPWTILAIEATGVWSFLKTTGDNKRTRALARKMRARIREHMPRYGPPDHPYHGTMLKGTGGIGELRMGPKNGPKLRVLYFFGRARKEIVLAHGFWKKDDTAPAEIQRAQAMQRAYFGAKKILIIDKDVRGTS